MRYLILIASNAKTWANMPTEELARVQAEYRDYGEAIKRSGHFVAGSQLPRDKATTIRQRNGKLEMVDGPFAETKEQLGGFYLIEVKDHDEAMAVAGRCPGAKYGCLDVRPTI
ncbi:MAG TPA: YciI family protein [Gemmatimonadales bacterium]|nr:YciI family protein [Gemmatimonadales bacterium]